MSDAILIYPKSSYLEQGFVSQYLPLSLLSISRYAVSEFDIKIIDQRTNKNWKNDLIRELNRNPLCVGITSVTGEQINHGIEISKLIKEYDKKILIVWGGPHVSLLPEQALKNKYIDLVIIGEGELTFYELLKALKSNKGLKGIDGLWYKKDGIVKKNKFRTIHDLNKFPEVPYDLVNIKDYIIKVNKRKRLVLETSRGCSNRCHFCYYSSTIIDFNAWRALTAENAVKQIHFLMDAFRVNEIEFIDDNFFVSLKRAENILKEITRLDLTWITVGTINYSMKMDKDFLSLMKMSNLYRLGQGVESGSQRILDLINKGITLSQIKDVAKKFAKFNIPALYSFMLGFPTETKGEIKATIKLASYLLKQNQNARISILHCFRPLPNNSLFNLAINLGLKEPKSLEEWGKYSMDHINFPWIPKKTQKLIKNLNFVSLFVDKKHEEVDHPFIKPFTRIYKPLAFYRMQNMNFNLMLEPKLKNLFIHLRDI